MEDISDIKNYYDSNQEVNRYQSQQLEFNLTCELFDKYLIQPNKILELGAGGGFYTLFLASKGHQVTAVELSPQLSQYSKQLLSNSQFTQNVEHVCQDVRTFQTENSYSCILNMGPNYHLQDITERKKLAHNCHDFLTEDGYLISTFLTRVGVLSYMMNRYPDWIAKNFLDFDAIFKQGINHAHPKNGVFRGYFTTIEEIRHHHLQTQFEIEAIHCTDPLIAGDDNVFNQLSDDLKAKWLEKLVEISQDELVWGSGRTLFVVAKKK